MLNNSVHSLFLLLLAWTALDSALCCCSLESVWIMILEGRHTRLGGWQPLGNADKPQPWFLWHPKTPNSLVSQISYRNIKNRLVVHPRTCSRDIIEYLLELLHFLQHLLSQIPKCFANIISRELLPILKSSFCSSIFLSSHPLHLPPQSISSWIVLTLYYTQMP